MEAISANGLAKSYGSVRALRDVTFSVDKGEIIGLLGPNGAGKTTLMKILTGFLQADEGEATVGGHEVGEEVIEVQRKIGYLPEHAPLYHDMTVYEYLSMIAELRGVQEKHKRSRLRDAVDATGLADYVGRPIDYLSKGYRQRVGIAQALVHKPEILILDEPTTGLDPTQIVEIRALIQKLAKSATVLLSTHILPEVEMTCERVLIIARGQLRSDSKLADLRATNAAIVAVSSGGSEVSKLLEQVEGVDQVDQVGTEGGFTRWRVTSDSNAALCEALYQRVKDTDWRMSELRSDTRTLESVFHDVVSAADAGEDKR